MAIHSHQLPATWDREIARDRLVEFGKLAYSAKVGGKIDGAVKTISYGRMRLYAPVVRLDPSSNEDVLRVQQLARDF